VSRQSAPPAGSTGASIPPVRHAAITAWGPGTWAVLEAAAALGHDIRVGLEDVLTLPDGEIAPGNAELVAAAS
jgi:uncharacterized protein (DUF849 family)